MEQQEQKKIERPFLTLEETCDYLSLKPATIYQYTHKRIIPFYKLRGRKLYFKREDFKNFIFNDMNRHKAQTELDSEALLRINT